MALTGRRSVQTFIGYYSSGDVSICAAARLTGPEELIAPAYCPPW